MKGLLIFSTLLLILILGCKSNNEATIKIVDKAYVKTNVIGKAVQLVDVRTFEEYDSGHLGGAVNYNIISRDTFLLQIQSLDKTKPVYLYCKMGGRSNRAANLLKEQGFEQIFDYSGGYNDWISE